VPPFLDNIILVTKKFSPRSTFAYKVIRLRKFSTTYGLKTNEEKMHLGFHQIVTNHTCIINLSFLQKQKSSIYHKQLLKSNYCVDIMI